MITDYKNQVNELSWAICQTQSVLESCVVTINTVAQTIPRLDDRSIDGFLPSDILYGVSVTLKNLHKELQTTFEFADKKE